MINSFRLNMIKALEYFKGPRGETIRYLIIGGFTTLVDYVSFYVMDKLLYISVTVSNITSTALAILFAYVTNKLVVFVSKTNTLTELFIEFLKFIGARLFTMLIEIGGVYLLVNILKQDDILGKVASIVIVIVVNYFLSKYLVFRKRRE